MSHERSVDIAMRLRAILRETKGQLDAQTCLFVSEFIEANELVLALETLFFTLRDQGPISGPVLDAMSTLADEMNLQIDGLRGAR